MKEIKNSVIINIVFGQNSSNVDNHIILMKNTENCFGNTEYIC